MADEPAKVDDDDDDVRLPPVPQRQWVIARLRELVKIGGIAPLVCAPQLQPTEAYFPDPWAGGDASVRRLLRRLCRYAGLDDGPVSVTIVEDGPGGPGVSAGATSPVWFDGIREGRRHFGVAAAALRAPMVIVPASARAVAEAWRAHHRLQVTDEGPVQQLVDVTAVYLGFGRLTLDAAIRHAMQTANLRGRATKTRLGVLSPMALAWALGVVLVVRDTDDAEVRRLSKGMQVNPTAFLRAAVERLREADPHVCEQLELPDPETWPPEYDLDVLTAPLPEADADAEVEPVDEAAHADRGVVGSNVGQPVFRVERSKALRLAKMLALPVILLAMLAGRMNMGIDVPMWQAGAAAAVLGILGLAVGRMLPDSRCSEPKCGTPLTPDDRVCPRCGGTVMGVIHHPKERLAAEDALRRSGAIADDDESAEAESDDDSGDDDGPDTSGSHRAAG